MSGQSSAPPRFKIGCMGLNEYVFKLGFGENPYCEYCPKYQIEDTNYFILLCPKYEEYRDDLKESLKTGYWSESLVTG